MVSLSLSFCGLLSLQFSKIKQIPNFLSDPQFQPHPSASTFGSSFRLVHLTASFTNRCVIPCATASPSLSPARNPSLTLPPRAPPSPCNRSPRSAPPQQRWGLCFRRHQHRRVRRRCGRSTRRPFHRVRHRSFDSRRRRRQPYQNPTCFHFKKLPVKKLEVDFEIRSEMAEHGEEAKAEQSLMDKISEKIHHDSSSSSSDSDTEKEKKAAPADETAKEKVFRLFGRERPVHHVFGGGKPADVFLWRKPKISAGILGGATVVYVLFELVEYHLLTLLCHLMIAGLVLMFLWSNVHTLIYKTAPHIPVVSLPEEPFLQLASEVRHHVNWAFELLHNLASGKDLKKFLIVIAGLWVLSVVGSWCNFLSLFYISFVLLHTLPVLYEKYEHKVDPLAEKATIEMKKQYGVFDAKVVTKVRETVLKNKRT